MDLLASSRDQQVIEVEAEKTIIYICQYLAILLGHTNILLLSVEIATAAFSPVNINTLLLTHSSHSPVSVRKFTRENFYSNFIDKTRAAEEVKYKMETITSIIL